MTIDHSHHRPIQFSSSLYYFCFVSKIISLSLSIDGDMHSHLSRENNYNIYIYISNEEDGYFFNILKDNSICHRPITHHPMYIYVQVVLGNAFVSFSLAHALWATKFMPSIIYIKNKNK